MIKRFAPGMSIALAAWLSLAAVSGCVQPAEPQRINAPPQGEGPAHPTWSDCYAYHNDQGMMADMSLGDIHFVPQSAELSGTGIARLERYAELLATSGGTLHYAPSMQDEALIQQRLVCAQAFLEQTVPGDKAIKVVVGLPGGRGMSSAESKAGRAVAQEAEKRERSYRLSRKEKD
jgi:hypothetical protein